MGLRQHKFRDIDRRQSKAADETPVPGATLVKSSLGADLRRAKRRFSDARAVAEAVGCELRLPRVEEPTGRGGERLRGCDWPWRSAYVTHSGAVQPCCMVMGSDRATLGDLESASFGEIWAGSGYSEFRRQLQTDTPPEVCRGCSLYRGVF